MRFLLVLDINGDTNSVSGKFLGDELAYKIIKKSDDIVTVKCWHDEGYGDFSCRVRVVLKTIGSLKAVKNHYSKFYLGPTKTLINDRKKLPMPPAEIKYLKIHPPILEFYMCNDEKEDTISLMTNSHFDKYKDTDEFIIILDSYQS